MSRLLALLLTSSLLYSMSLEEAISLALKNNPSLQSKRLDIEAQKLQKEAIKAQTLGKVNLNAAYNHYNIPRTLKPLTPPITPNITTSKDILSAGVEYKVALFNGFADKVRIDLAALGFKMKEIGYKLAKNETVYNIKALYFKALGLKSDLQALKARKKALSALKRKVEYGVKLGKKAPLDLLKIRSDLLGVESSIVKVKNGIESIKAALKALIGIKIDKFEDAKEEAVQKNTTPYLVKKMQLEVKKTQRELKKAKSLSYPKLFFQGMFNQNFAKGESEDIWQGGVIATYPIIDFGYKKKIYQKSKIATLQAKKNLLFQKEMLKSKIEGAKLEINSLYHTLKALQSNLELLKEIQHSEKIQYDTGYKDVSDYLQAIANTQKAKSAISKTKYTLFSKYAYLNYLQAGD